MGRIDRVKKRLSSHFNVGAYGPLETAFIDIHKDEQCACPVYLSTVHVYRGDS